MAERITWTRTRLRGGGCRYKGAGFTIELEYRVVGYGRRLRSGYEVFEGTGPTRRFLRGFDRLAGAKAYCESNQGGGES